MRFFVPLVIFIKMASAAYAIDGLLIKTIDYSFQDKWNNTVGTSVPKITTCEKVYKGQYFYIAAIISDYTLDKNNTANSEYSVKITGPENSIFLTKSNLKIIKKKLVGKLNLQMSDDILKASFSDKDAIGEYKI